MPHEFEPTTEYCIHCGASRQNIIWHELKCDTVGNVIGVSHIIGLRKLNALEETHGSSQEQSRPA